MLYRYARLLLMATTLTLKEGSNMGFWSDVQYDIQRGMSESDAINLNAILRDPKASKREKESAEAIAEASIKLNTML